MAFMAIMAAGSSHLPQPLLRSGRAPRSVDREWGSLKAGAGRSRARSPAINWKTLGKHHENLGKTLGKPSCIILYNLV